jgi:putative DNA primase/helicase
MVLNAALMKQLTGGDTYTGRYLNENLFEFQMEGKPFINTNHKPHVTDDTIFASGRVKIIPFNRHFSESEQDKGLKREFRKAKIKSAILNWMVMGWRLIQETGFDAPPAVVQATAEYREEADVIGVFLSERTVPAEGKRLATRQLYLAYQDWAKSGGYKAADNRAFVQDLRRRLDVGKDYKLGNVVLCLELSAGQFCGSAADYVSDLSDVSGSAS